MIFVREKYGNQSNLIPIFLLFVTFILTSFDLHANATIKPYILEDGDFESISLLDYTYIYIDSPTHFHTIDEVLSLDFRPLSKAEFPDGGFECSNHRYWYRIVLVNQSSESMDDIHLYFGNQDRFFVYEIQDNAAQLKAQLGTEYPAKKYKDKFMLYDRYPIQIRPHEQKQLLVHISNGNLKFESVVDIHPYLVKDGYQAEFYEENIRGGVWYRFHMSMGFTALLMAVGSFMLLSLFLSWRLKNVHFLLFGLLCFFLFLYHLRDLEVYAFNFHLLRQIPELGARIEFLLRALIFSTWMMLTFSLFKFNRYRPIYLIAAGVVISLGIIGGLWFMFGGVIQPWRAIYPLEMLIYNGFIILSLLLNLVLFIHLKISKEDHALAFVIGTGMFMFFNYGFFHALFPELTSGSYFLSRMFCRIYAVTILLLSFGSIIGRVAVQSERERKNKELALEKLSEREKLQSSFFTNISHEFRTPLSVILGLADELKSHDDIKTKIQNNGQSLLRYINQILDHSKLSSGFYKKTLSTAYPYIVISTAIESISYLAQNKSIKINHTSTIERSKQANLDVEKIQAIVVNLLVNAIKYSPVGSQIHIDSRLDDKQNLNLRIEDQGKGISEEDLEHIFSPYYRIDEVSDGNMSSGLGLSIVEKYINLLEGKIDVSSTLGIGSSFSVSIPIKDVSREIKPRQDIGSPTQGMITTPEISQFDEGKLSLDQKEKITILLAEDHHDVAYYIKSILEGDKYKIVQESDGRKALTKAQEIMPDMILSDIMMPELNGYELCQFLKEDPTTSHIPIIMLTARADESDKLRGIIKGADAYLTKPINKGLLLATIEQIVNRQDALRSYYQSKFLSAGSEPRPAAPLNPFIEKVVDIIDNRYTDPDFDVNTLCKEIYLDRTQVFRKIKAIAGVTPAQMIKRVRLQKAHELITNSSKSIGEIALESGFSNASHFSRLFINFYSKKPSELRKLSRNIL